MMLDIGSGAFLMWNNISPRLGGEFPLMHTRDHVPEHMSYLGADGMQWARRYADGQGDMPRFFTFYGMPDLSVLSDSEHADCRVTETQWFLKMRPDYQDREAHHCRVVASAGGGIGGAAATFVIDLAERHDAAEANSQASMAAFIDDLTKMPDVVTAHLFKVDWDAPLRQGLPPPGGREGNERLGLLVLEGFDRYALSTSMEATTKALIQSGISTGVRSSAHYALAYVLGIEEIPKLKYFRRDDTLIRERYSID